MRKLITGTLIAGLLGILVSTVPLPVNAQIGYAPGGTTITGFTDLGDVPAAGGSGDLWTFTSTLNAMDGSDTVSGINLTFTNGNHTGSGNTFAAIEFENITDDAQSDEIGIRIGTGYNYNVVGMAGSFVNLTTGVQQGYKIDSTFGTSRATYGLGVNNVGAGIYSHNGFTFIGNNNSQEYGVLEALETSLTAAQVNALQTTAVDVSAAPPAGYVAILEGCTMYLAADVTAPFAGVDAGEDFQILYETTGDAASAVCDEATCLNLDATTPAGAWIPHGYAAGVEMYANLTKKLQLKIIAGDGNTGGADTDLKILCKFWYQKLDS